MTMSRPNWSGCAKRGTSLDELANRALRLGLRQFSTQARAQQPFRTRSFDCGPLLIDSIDSIGNVLATLDAEDFLDLDRRNRRK